MAIKTLDELNREFMFERITGREGAASQPHSPLSSCIPNPVTSLSDNAPQTVTQLKTIVSTDTIVSAKPIRSTHIEAPGETEPLRSEAPEIIETIRPQLTEHLEKQPPRRRRKKKSGMVTLVSDVLFYLAIIVILLTTVFSGGNGGAPKVIMGYSYFTVLTTSMQDEIPKGSFILVHETDPQELQVGDTITYMRDASTSVTHKIVNIFENYQEDGGRGFQTQGVNNLAPDKDIVHAANVVGKVVFSLPTVGALIANLRSNIHLVFIIFGLCVILSFSLRGLFIGQIVKQVSKNASKSTSVLR